MTSNDSKFISAIKHKFNMLGLPVFCATETNCIVKQSIPENPAIKHLEQSAKLLGLKVVSLPVSRLANHSLLKVRRELHSCRDIASKYNISNYFIVSEQASITNNNNSRIIRALRDSLISWESLNNGDPDEDWRALVK